MYLKENIHKPCNQVLLSSVMSSCGRVNDKVVTVLEPEHVKQCQLYG
jgi:hypothetical protein